MSPKSLLLALLLAPTTLFSASERVLVCLGDSLTAGLGVNEERAYPALVEKELSQGIDPWRVVNAGISGDTSAGGLKRVDWVLKSRPQVVFIALGANDGLRGLDPKATEANLRSIIKKVKAAGAVPLLAGLDLPTNLGSVYRQDFKALYPRLARAEKVALLDFLLQDVGGVASLNQADGMHPNEAGHAIVAKHVLEFLKVQLKSLPKANAKGAAKPQVLRRRNALGVGQ